MTRSRFLTAWLLGGLLFLYGPIAVLVATSFNASSLMTEWTGFSLRWYRALLHDRTLIDAALLSLRIAAVAATGATVLGGLAGFALARMPNLAGRRTMAGLLAAPLVLPDLLIGLSLLLLFVASEMLLGVPNGRGAGTVAIAHATMCLSYVAVVVEARLAAGGTVLEMAAMDLGAGPVMAFLRITLPLMAPALVSGWLLAFTLSLDDVVVASFTSGPGATTLPMVVYSTLRLGPTPVLNALATVVLALAAGAAAAIWVLGRRGEAAAG
ncbi:MAG TPA: putrescine ABC transporter permease PotI [Rhodopila sp.]|uniref:putrescine ABC transporter permease PotI n=1 Tax=Rhodopila sp. TaxID=2480087 RepID=UPI002C7AFEDB|nr:putrescine ABC transporter permease PotI [Rhodopila sp.]HVY16801.1 putrescine ABC transporter permease PotI [Rhodopila sp.]